MCYVFTFRPVINTGKSMTDRTAIGRSIFWLIAFCATAAWVMAGLRPFATMCCISLSLFGLIKCHTLMGYRKTAATLPDLLSTIAWFVAWPGLDPKAFFEKSDAVVRTRRNESVLAICKTLSGVALLIGVAPLLLDVNELLAGWIALLGTVFILHFGTFHILAILWRSKCRAVKPIMNAPIAATSVSEFWSKRWNLAFRDYAHPHLFKPLARKSSPVVAVVVGYAFSGLVHELAISVPAGGGFGLPTAYFTIQGIAILVERRLKLRGGMSGWLWTFAITAPGAFMLFHPPFVRNVVVPLVEFIRDGGML